MKKRNSEKEHSQDIGNPYRSKPNLTDKKPSGGMLGMFGAMMRDRNWYGKKDAPPPPAMPDGDMHFDTGRFTD